MCWLIQSVLEQRFFDQWIYTVSQIRLTSGSLKQRLYTAFFYSLFSKVKCQIKSELLQLTARVTFSVIGTAHSG